MLKLNFKLFLMTMFTITLLVVANNAGKDSNITPKLVEQFNNVKVDPKQLECMALNIFYEARNESIKGQAAVAKVVLNRVAHGFAKTPCGVIYQTTIVNDTKVCQFSWVCEDKPKVNPNNYRYKVAKQIAYDVMVNDKYDDVLPDSALFFHNMSVSPLWPYVELARIGNHIFYSKYKKHNTKKENKYDN